MRLWRLPTMHDAREMCRGSLPSLARLPHRVGYADPAVRSMLRSGRAQPARTSRGPLGALTPCGMATRRTQTSGRRPRPCRRDRTRVAVRSESWIQRRARALVSTRPRTITPSTCTQHVPWHNCALERSAMHVHTHTHTLHRPRSKRKEIFRGPSKKKHMYDVQGNETKARVHNKLNENHAALHWV
jgi:hypothetical protein